MDGIMEDLQRENAFLRRILEGAVDSILAVSGGGRIAFSNAAASHAFGYSAEEFLGLDAAALFSAEAPGGLPAEAAAALARGQPWTGDAVAQRRGGATFPVRLDISRAPAPGGPGEDGATRQNWAVLYIRDVEDQQRVFARLKQLSILDDLTGLHNARYFWARLRYEFVRSDRYSQPLSCLMVDLDRFKSVNDVYGHLAGDAALKFVSKIMAASIREADILSRYGGEEFAIILPSTPQSGAVTCAEKIRLAVAENALTLGGVTIRLTASFGVASLTPDLGNEEQLARRADEALLQAKKLGKNRVCLWSPECPRTEAPVPPEVPPDLSATP